MPTENPKISAYVPQVVYDRFKQFQEERGLSMSQAAIEVFVEYFGINLADSSTKESTSGLLERVAQLEQLVADLKQSYVYLSQKVESIQTTGESPKFESDNKAVNIYSDSLNEPPDRTPTLMPSEPLFESLVDDSSVTPSEPENELPIIKHLAEQERKLVDGSSTLSIPQSEIPNLLPHQSEIVKTGDSKDDNLLSNLPSKPGIKINHPVLAQRLKATEGYLKSKKSESTTEEFTEWTTKKDPDKIGWQSMKEGKKVYYYPIGDLSDEQKTNLQDWLTKNQNSVD